MKIGKNHMSLVTIDFSLNHGAIVYSEWKFKHEWKIFKWTPLGVWDKKIKGSLYFDSKSLDKGPENIIPLIQNILVAPCAIEEGIYLLPGALIEWSSNNTMFVGARKKASVVEAFILGYVYKMLDKNVKFVAPFLTKRVLKEKNTTDRLEFLLNSKTGEPYNIDISIPFEKNLSNKNGDIWDAIAIAYSYLLENHNDGI